MGIPGTKSYPVEVSGLICVILGVLDVKTFHNQKAELQKRRATHY